MKRFGWRIITFSIRTPVPSSDRVKNNDAKLNYIHREDLAPGKDDSLDHICNFLIKGCPLFDCPTMEERSRTTADEDAFFEELAHSPDYLRNTRYERWLRLKSLGRSTKELVRRLPFGPETRSLTWEARMVRVFEVGGSPGNRIS